MGLLRDDLEAYQKILGISVLAIMFFGILGLYSKFIPSEPYMFYSSITSVVLGLCILLLNAVHIKRNQRAYDKWYYYVMFAFLWVFFSYLTLVLGIPSLLNKSIGKQHHQPVTVAQKQFGSFRGNCSNRFHVKELASVISRGLCVPSDLYNRINSGDTLILVGKKSWIGISVNYLYEKPNNSSNLTGAHNAPSS